jgi:hypothetical protein
MMVSGRLAWAKKHISLALQKINQLVFNLLKSLMTHRSAERRKMLVLSKMLKINKK